MEPTKYVAILNQSGTNPPTAVVLENTLGAPLGFTYDDAGAYYTSGVTFPAGKTVCFITNGLAHIGSASCMRVDDGTVLIVSVDTASNQSDSVLRNASIEIRVYP